MNYDVNNDGSTTALDALLVINEIARSSNSSVEGIRVLDGNAIPNLIELTGAAIQTWDVEMDPMAITDCPREPEMLVARKSSRLNSTADASHDVAESLRADTDGVGEASESKSDRAELIDAALLSLLAE